MVKEDQMEQSGGAGETEGGSRRLRSQVDMDATRSAMDVAHKERTEGRAEERRRETRWDGKRKSWEGEREGKR